MEEAEGEDADIVLECDAVVVGSGAGGGPVADVLAGAGLRVIVVERSGYNPVDTLSLAESPLLPTSMVERGGLLSTDNTGAAPPPSGP